MHEFNIAGEVSKVFIEPNGVLLELENLDFEYLEDLKKEEKKEDLEEKYITIKNLLIAKDCRDVNLNKSFTAKFCVSNKKIKCMLKICFDQVKFLNISEIKGHTLKLHCSDSNNGKEFNITRIELL